MYDPFHLQIKKHTQRDETDKNIDAGTNSTSQESYSKMTFPTLLEKKKKSCTKNYTPSNGQKTKQSFYSDGRPRQSTQPGQKTSI